MFLPVRARIGMCFGNQLRRDRHVRHLSHCASGWRFRHKVKPYRPGKKGQNSTGVLWNHFVAGVAKVPRSFGSFQVGEIP
jgi:hypothetical protein